MDELIKQTLQGLDSLNHSEQVQFFGIIRKELLNMRQNRLEAIYAAQKEGEELISQLKSGSEAIRNENSQALAAKPSY